MKLFKRNAIVLTVIVFVCAAVYLNWAYNRPNADDVLDTQLSSVADPNQTVEINGLFYDEQEQATNDKEQLPVPVSDYFADARLARQQARDSAVTILRETSESSAASQDVIDRSLADISAMAVYSLEEAEIESLIRAKGFNECVVFMGDNSVTVTVPAPYEGLSTSAVARITDVVTSETDLGFEQIKIVEVK
jgi:stage III sporulation protein AH